MNIIFKRVDSWGQLIMIAITAITAVFMPFLVTSAYIFIGTWQLISVTLYLLLGTKQEKTNRKKYWIGLIIYIIVCFASFKIKDLVILTIYLLWFVPAFFAVWYCYITIKESNIWPFRHLKS
ncbi:MAG: hypothetical protein RL135_427 [Bacteroidota bacterium]|jgi:hypothetical protein